MYKKINISVRSATDKDLWFNVRRGLWKGSVLSPLSFVLLVDQIVKTENELSAGAGRNGTTDSYTYADDARITANS